MPEHCEYNFRHPNRTKARCGLETVVGATRCIYHTQGGVQNSGLQSEQIRTMIESVVATSGHWLEGVLLAGVQLGTARLEGAKMPYADLSHAILSEANLSSAFLQEARLDYADLRSATLNKAALTGASMRRAKLSSSTFTECDFVGADLQDCTMSNATLTYCDLRSVNMAGANLMSAIFCQTRLYGASFRGANLDDVEWDYYRLDQETLKEFASICQHLAVVHSESCNYGGADEFYYRAMTALHLDAIGSRLKRFDELSLFRESLRLAPKWKKVFPVAAWGLRRWLWGYGVLPSRVLCWMCLCILLFGVLYPVIGLSTNGQPTTGTPLRGVATSLVTFATLGYGNVVPTGWVGEMIGGTEAILGSLLSSAFLVSLATKYVRR